MFDRKDPGTWVGGLIAICVFLFICSRIGGAFGLTKSDWPGWVQAIGSVCAILAAVWVSYDQHMKARQRDADKETQEIKNILKSLRDELAVTAEGFAQNMGALLDASNDDEPFEFEWQPAEKPFVIFDACASQIGKIENDDLRRDVIRTYAQARGLLLSLKMNTLLREKVESNVLYWHEKDPDFAKELYDKNRVNLVNFANKMRASHRIAKVSVADLIRDIDTYLATNISG